MPGTHKSCHLQCDLLLKVFEHAKTYSLFHNGKTEFSKINIALNVASEFPVLHTKDPTIIPTIDLPDLAVMLEETFLLRKRIVHGRSITCSSLYVLIPRITFAEVLQNEEDIYPVSGLIDFLHHDMVRSYTVSAEITSQEALPSRL